MEVRFPLTFDPNVLQIAPFFEIGTAWNNRESDPDPAKIASVGLGLRWRITSDLLLRLDYGIPLLLKIAEIHFKKTAFISQSAISHFDCFF